MASSTETENAPPANVDGNGGASGTADEDVQGSEVYNVFLTLTAILALVLIAWDYLSLPDHSQFSKLVDIIDSGVCVVFFYDFLRNLSRAPDRWRYLRGWGVVDFLASLPFYGPLRAFRLVRIIRVFRAIKSVRSIIDNARRDRRSATLTLTMAVVIVALVASCFGVLHFELDYRDQYFPPSDKGQSLRALIQVPHVSGALTGDAPIPVVVELQDGTELFAQMAREPPNIRTAGDAVWWALATVSTVGYGDRYPVSDGGRACGVILMIVGTGLFAAMAGILVDLLRSLSERDKR